MMVQERGLITYLTLSRGKTSGSEKGSAEVAQGDRFPVGETDGRRAAGRRRRKKKAQCE